MSCCVIRRATGNTPLVAGILYPRLGSSAARVPHRLLAVHRVNASLSCGELDVVEMTNSRLRPTRRCCQPVAQIRPPRAEAMPRGRGVAPLLGPRRGDGAGQTQLAAAPTGRSPARRLAACLRPRCVSSADGRTSTRIVHKTSSVNSPSHANAADVPKVSHELHATTGPPFGHLITTFGGVRAFFLLCSLVC